MHEFISAVRDRDEDRLIWAAVEAMSPAETAFFREPGVFEYIVGQVLPDLARRREGGPLRLWAAGCGTGQEVYSLAMALEEAAPAGLTLEVFGSDLCERRLEKAQVGVYSQFEVQRGLSAQRLVRHFEGLEDGFALSPRVRQMVRWRRVNLMEDISRLGQFDLVLCRNLMGYLLDEARGRVLANLRDALAPGGRLVLGATEAAPGLVAAADRQHPAGREPVQADGEHAQDQDADDEVGHRVQDQRDPVADVVDRAAAFPARIGAQGESEDDRQDLAQAKQDDRRPEPAEEDVGHLLAVELERVAQVAGGG